MPGWVLAAIIALALTRMPPVPVNDPNNPWVPKLWPLLNKYAAKTNVPLGFAIGWIHVESDGNIRSYTDCNERGYFQIMGDTTGPSSCSSTPVPWQGSEAQQIGIQKWFFPYLSQPGYEDASMAWGFQLANFYANKVENWGITRGSEFFWRTVKLCHAISAGGVDCDGYGNPCGCYAALANAGWVQDWATVVAFNPKLAKHFEHIDEVFTFGRKYGSVSN